MAPQNFLPMSPCVSGVAATLTDTTSASLARLMSLEQYPTPSRSACSSVRLRDHATMFIPKALPRSAISRPIRPSPTIPRVRPYSPAALAYSALFHVPLRRSAVWSGTRRSQARISAQASSATAIEFLPGQLATKMPRSEAVATSIVSYPAPARTIRLRALAPSNTAAFTLVPRTRRMSGSCTATAAARASAAKSGSIRTQHPSDSIASTPVESNLSAISTLVSSDDVSAVASVRSVVDGELVLMG